MKAEKISQKNNTWRITDGDKVLMEKITLRSSVKTEADVLAWYEEHKDDDPTVGNVEHERRMADEEALRDYMLGKAAREAVSDEEAPKRVVDAANRHLDRRRQEA